MYIEFCDNYSIDYLIISRNSKYLYYSHGVKKIYLWFHDIGDVSDKNNLLLQTHKEKFKRILCLCNWHKKFLISFLGEHLEDKIHITRNAIKLERFLDKKDVFKQSMRFIYFSGPSRGLQRLLSLFPKIRERYCDAELYIFCNDFQLEKEGVKIISSKGGVKKTKTVTDDTAEPVQYNIMFTMIDMIF